MKKFRLGGLGIKDKVYFLSCWIKNKLGQPDLFNLNTAERIGCAYHEPSDMCATDRLMLYALVRGLRPATALEIGVRWGGSSRIITNAMEDNKKGSLVGIEPLTESFRVSKRDLHNRYTLKRGYSPQDLPMVLRGLQPLDFVLIDAMHIHDAVIADFKGVLPYLNEGAHILFHDTFHQGINQAICEVLLENPILVDLGFITRDPAIGFPVSYQGLRLVRKGAVNGEQLITESYRHQGQKVPAFSEKYWNHDEYYNRISKP